MDNEAERVHACEVHIATLQKGQHALQKEQHVDLVQGPGCKTESLTQSTSFAGLDAKLQALAHLFELASTTTQADQPLCLDCAAQLKDEIEAQDRDGSFGVLEVAIAYVCVKVAFVAYLR
eukprot:1160684-Pelagomonas_calceolata.AAC.8